jgi:hypothetical protein
MPRPDSLISPPFHDGLVIVSGMAMTVLVIAAIASLLRGKRYVPDGRPLDGQDREHASSRTAP